MSDASSPTDPEAPHDPYAALRSRDFRLYFTGIFTAAFGYQMQAVAVGWELYDRTNSKLALGWVGLAQVIPVIALALPAGHVVDQYDRRRITIITQVVMILSALGMLATSFFHEQIDGGRSTLLSPILMYVCLLMAGFARAFQTPAKSALMTALVDKKDFSNAVMWNSGAFQSASIAGPILAGLMLHWTTLHWPKPQAWPVYAVDSVFMMVLLVNLMFIRGKPFVPVKRAMTLESMLAGLKFVYRTKMILASITLDMFAVLLGGAVALLPVYAKDILHVGPSGLGALQAAPAIGALMMGMIIAHRPPMKHAGRALLWAVAGFGVATVVFGLSKWFWLSIFMLFLTGAFDNISVVVRHSLVQVLTPDEMRGRVSAVNGVFIGASNELGGFESGAVAQAIGAVPTVVIGGIGTVLVVIASAFIWPEIRTFGRLDQAKEEKMENRAEEKAETSA